MRKNQCWVCLRITSAKTLKLAHQIWNEDSKIARKIGLKASHIIQHANHVKPIFFCGRSTRAILSGLFYLLGFQFETAKTLREIAEKTLTTDVTIKHSYRRWLSSFPKLFPEFGFEKILAVDIWRETDTVGLYPTFRGKRVNQYYKEASE